MQADDFDTGPIDIDEFVISAQKDLDNFATNVRVLENLKNKQMTQFRWYVTFGYWAEYLNHFDELNDRMKQE